MGRDEAESSQATGVLTSSVGAVVVVTIVAIATEADRAVRHT